jgi:N utilization substance protein A
LAPDNQLSLAIGRRGQNVRLASMLIGWNVTVISETEALEKSNNEYHAKSRVFMEALDCDEVIAHLLVTEDFSDVGELAGVTKENLASIDGFDEALAEELISRAKAYVNKKDQEISKELESLKIDKEIYELNVFSNDHLLKLAHANIRKLDDLADLSADELIDLLPELDRKLADEIILKARAHWFE